MKTKYVFLLIIVIISIFSVFAIIYGKNNMKHIDYNKYIKSSIYCTNFENDSKVYDLFPETKDFLILSNDINSAEDIINKSDYILQVKTNSKPILIGKSIINNCIIEKVIKGKNLNVGENIKIYDMSYGWFHNHTDYLFGSTPLANNNVYIVFLKKAPYPTVKDTYSMISFKYGHVNLNNNNHYLLDYDNCSKLVKNISQYDYVFGSEYSDEEIIKYVRIVNEILELVK